MAQEYVAAYYSYLDFMAELSDAECGRLFKACLIYGKTGTAPELRGNERFVWPGIKSQIDRDSQKYQEKCEKNAKNATATASDRKRTQATASDRKRTQATASERSQGKGKGEGKGEGKREGKGESNPPTPLEGVSPALASAFDDWLKYKAERREGYKPTGLKSLQTQVLDKAGEYGDDAVAALIRECMAANYQGIIFDRLRGGKKNGDTDGHSAEGVKYGTWL